MNEQPPLTPPHLPTHPTSCSFSLLLTKQNKKKLKTQTNTKSKCLKEHWIRFVVQLLMYMEPALENDWDSHWLSIGGNWFSLFQKEAGAKSLGTCAVHFPFPKLGFCDSFCIVRLCASFCTHMHRHGLVSPTEPSICDWPLSQVTPSLLLRKFSSFSSLCAASYTHVML